MSDEELRRLERVYLQSGSSEDLLALNIHRIRAGLLPVREDPNFLMQWAADIHSLAESEDDPVTVPWDPDGTNWFTGNLPLDKLNIPISLDVIVEEDIEKRDPKIYPQLRSLEISFEPLHSSLSQVRAWLIRAIVFDDFVMVTIPREQPPDWNLRTPYEEKRRIPNQFLTAKDMMDYLLVIYLQETQAKWKERLETPHPMVTAPVTHTDGQIYLLGTLQAGDLLQKTKQFLNEPNYLMDFSITTPWFRRILANFARGAEEYLIKRRNMRFDLEQTWPTSITFSDDHYALSIETGYNDVIDLDEFDREYPEGRRGLVDQVISDFADGLEKFSESQWDAEWDYEEDYEEGSEDIAIRLKAETPLTAKLLERLLTRYGLGGLNEESHR